MYNELINTFITVVEYGSFSKASQKLYCSNVSIMKQMNALEEKIGVKLLNRTHRGIRLTPAGESIYKDALEIINLSNKAIEKAKAIEKSEKKTIRIGTSLMRPCKPLIDLINLVSYTTLPFQIEIVPFDDIHLFDARSIIGKEFDCFASPLGRTKWLNNFNTHFLREYRCCILLPKNHKLSKKDILTWDDLDNESILLIKQGESTVFDNLREEIKKEHPLINLIDTNDFYTLNTFNDCIKNNYLIEAIEPWNDIHPALSIKPVDWKYRIPYGIVYSLNPSKQMIEFIDFVEEIMSSKYVNR